MILDMYQLDAFTDVVFAGNPAAICPLNRWIADDQMQSIATENNLSETAFYVPIAGGFHLRWFTPTAEVDLCGHATLAAAALLFDHLHYEQPIVRFKTRSGWLSVMRKNGGFEMDFPIDVAEACQTPALLAEAIPAETEFVGRSKDDYLVVLADEMQLRSLQPDYRMLKALGGRGVLVTAKGNDVDFVSRCFFPFHGIDEDPVTGSAHCTLAPYWSHRLGRNKLSARQISARGGDLLCEVDGDRVRIMGQAKLFMKGQIFLA